jgi:peptide-methionine (S)-S-oxide reductase
MVERMAETATFAAGCFWGVEAEFRGLDGVTATRLGYTGGRTEHPPAAALWPAEEYHQRYLEKRGQAACAAGLTA